MFRWGCSCWNCSRSACCWRCVATRTACARLPRLHTWALVSLVALPLLCTAAAARAYGASMPGPRTVFGAISLARGGQKRPARPRSASIRWRRWPLIKLLLPVAVFSRRACCPRQPTADAVLAGAGMGRSRLSRAWCNTRRAGRIHAVLQAASGSRTAPTQPQQFRRFLLSPADARAGACWWPRWGERAPHRSSLRERVVFWSTLRGPAPSVMRASRAGCCWLVFQPFARRHCADHARRGVAVLPLARLGGRRDRFGPVSTVTSIALGLAGRDRPGAGAAALHAGRPGRRRASHDIRGHAESIDRFFPLGAGAGSFRQAFFPFQDPVRR